MKASKVLINVLIILLVLAALWLGYVWFMSEGRDNGLPTVSVSQPGAEIGESEIESEFLVLLRRLRNVNFEENATAFLNDPIFTTELRDFTTTISEGPRGRQNPFAPFGVGDIQSGQQTLPQGESPDEFDFTEDFPVSEE